MGRRQTTTCPGFVARAAPELQTWHALRVERRTFRGAALLAVLVCLLACCGTGAAGAPSDVSSPPDGGGGGASASPDVSSAPLPEAGPPDVGDASGAPAPSAACVSYCDLIMPTCAADYPQYGSMTACLNACAFIPPGTAADPENENNTLKCRVFHTMGGGGHCFHGGPYGYGGCGSMCEGFCQLAMGWCAASKGGAAFPSVDACQATCELWPWAPTGADGAAAYRATMPTSGNTLECREVQLTMSLESAAARDTYCPFAVDDSAPCR